MALDGWWLFGWLIVASDKLPATEIIVILIKKGSDNHPFFLVRLCLVSGNSRPHRCGVGVCVAPTSCKSFRHCTFRFFAEIKGGNDIKRVEWFDAPRLVFSSFKILVLGGYLQVSYISLLSRPTNSLVNNTTTE